MGPHYLHTLAYSYLAPHRNHQKSVHLKGQSIIIDANSFIYFIYDKMLKDPVFNTENVEIPNRPFDYDAYWSYMRNILLKFKKQCSKIHVVFDGIYKRNANRRPDPERTSSLRFTPLKTSRNRLPSLFRREFINNLRELNINVFVARGEADPMIVDLAQDHDAYIVAGDSDYLLYTLPQGYVPLSYLKLEHLQGLLYHMNDVFVGMDTKGVALWTSLIKYDFVTLQQIQVKI